MEFNKNSNTYINEFEGVLIVSVNSDLDETILTEIQTSILNTIAAKSLDGVVLNCSKVKILDSFLIRKLEDITQMIELMGSNAILAGLSPEIVVSLVTLNIEPKTIKTALNIELAIGMLREIAAEFEEKQEDENLELEDIDELDETLT